MRRAEPSTFGLMILAALNKKPIGEIYLGTVPAHVKAVRRQRNMAARKARAITRRDGR